jgi:hypothetical protein
MARKRKPAAVLKRLPKSNNGTRRVSSSFGLYKGQKDDLRGRAHAKGHCVSYYVNWLLWRDWLHDQERRGR